MQRSYLAFAVMVTIFAPTAAVARLASGGRQIRHCRNRGCDRILSRYPLLLFFFFFFFFLLLGVSNRLGAVESRLLQGVFRLKMFGAVA